MPEVNPEETSQGVAGSRKRVFGEAFGTWAVVTALVTACSLLVPPRHVAAAVGIVFLGATWFFVWRLDDDVVERHGLALGGIVYPGATRWSRVASDAAVSVLWAVAFAAIVFVPFYFGWMAVWKPGRAFALATTPSTFLEDFVSQLAVIALPEEAFFRGYLQSRLDVAFPRRVRILGAEVGLSIVVTSALFAVGHIATIRSPARLAVFFPSLLFGWLRARTGGIGASVVFHATCNVFSETLGRGYGLY